VTSSSGISKQKKYKWIADCKENKNLSAYTNEEIEDFKRGFLVKGLFKYVRHPNYLGEIFIWWSIYAFTLSSQYSVFKDGFHFTDLFNYSMTSSLIMSVLFYRSTKLTESIQLKKYTEYRNYRAQTNMFFPSFSAYVPEKSK